MRKLNFRQAIFVLLLVLLLFAVAIVIKIVSGAIIQQFSNSLTTENLTYSGEENITRYVDIQKAATVEYVSLNLSGFKKYNITESYTEDDVSYAYFGNTDWAGQNFSVSRNITVGMISLKMKATYQDAESDTVNVYLMSQKNGQPSKKLATASKTSISSSAYAWYNFTLSRDVYLVTGKGYWIVVNAIGSANTNDFQLRRNNNPGAYGNGLQADSSDNGSTWTMNTDIDALFKIWSHTAPTDVWLEIGTADGTYEYAMTGELLDDDVAILRERNDTTRYENYTSTNTESHLFYIKLPQHAVINSAKINLTGY